MSSPTQAPAPTPVTHKPTPGHAVQFDGSTLSTLSIVQAFDGSCQGTYHFDGSVDSPILFIIPNIGGIPANIGDWVIIPDDGSIPFAVSNEVYLRDWQA